jgi:hypothetical protein
LSNKEKAGAFQQVVEVYPKRGVIEILNPNEATRENKKTFTYDAVYNANANQQTIYDEVVRPLVASVLEGFNGWQVLYFYLANIWQLRSLPKIYYLLVVSRMDKQERARRTRWKAHAKAPNKRA